MEFGDLVGAEWVGVLIVDVCVVMGVYYLYWIEWEERVLYGYGC